MVSKRTHSATQHQADGDSSNVTDYMGPSKRRGRVSKTETQTGKKILFRSTRRTAKHVVTSAENLEEEEEDDDDDDGPIGVEFNHVVSASNEAMRYRQRTVNGLRLTETQAVPNSPRPDMDDEDEDEQEGDGKETNHQEVVAVTPAPNASVGRHSPPRISMQNERRNQHAGPRTRQQTQAASAKNEPYHHSDYPGRQLRSGRKLAVEGEITNEKTSSQQNKEKQREQVSKRPAGAVQRDEQVDEAPISEEEKSEDMSVEVGEDSVFIEAPQPDEEELITVEAIINSLGGLIATLGQAAWTKSARWDIFFEINRNKDSSEHDIKRSITSSGRALMRHVEGLKILIEQAINSQHADDVEGAYERTLQYLRDNGTHVRRHFVRIDELTSKICTKSLVNNDSLTHQAITSKKRLLRDISERLIPMFVLVIRKICYLCPLEERRGKLHVHFNTFTLQFFLRAVGWARRLQRALARGLEAWPINLEFSLNEEDLDQDQVKQKYEMKESRDAVEKQFLKLYQVAKETEFAIQNQHLEARRKVLQEDLRQRRLVQEQELRAAKEREQVEEIRRNAERWEDFCRSTQALKYARDPMKEKWDAAENIWRQHQASHRPAFNNDSTQNTARAPSSTPSIPASGEARAEIDLAEDNPFGSPPVRNQMISDSRSLHKQNPGSRAEHGARQGFQENKPWGLDWTRAEEKTLLVSIRYNRDYNSVAMAVQLGRREYDVARKAAALKEAYRNVYRERGDQVPDWAW